MRVVLISMVAMALAAGGCVSGDSKGAKTPCTTVMPAGYPTTAEGLEIGDTAPDMQMLDMLGNQVCLNDYAGQVVLINSGAGWCPPCQDETPGIQAVYEEFESQGFVVLMAMLDDYTNNGSISNENFFNEWIADYGVTFTLLEDEGGDVYTKYVRQSDPYYGSIPANVLLDKDHVIRYSSVGGMTETALRNRVETQIQKPAVLEY